MATKDIKVHLILGQCFLTDQYRWNEEGIFYINNGWSSKGKVIVTIVVSAVLLWIVVPVQNKLDKTTYVVFNEVLFTYFSFMVLLLASYFSQKNHVETFNGLEEIDDTLAKMNIHLNPSSKTNHITIIMSYVFLAVSCFVNIYCSNFCDARSSTIFKFVLMSELIYKNSILAAVIRIMRDRFKSINDILRTTGKTNKSCLLCHGRFTSREEILEIFGSYSLEEYCLFHILKFVRVIHHKLTECATSWNKAMNPYVIIILMAAAVEFYTQILFLFTIFTRDKAITKAGVDTLGLSLFADLCIFGSMFNLLYCCQNMVEEWTQTARIVHRLFYTNKKNKSAVSEIMSFSYQLKQKPFRFVYIGRTPLDWGALIISFKTGSCVQNLFFYIKASMQTSKFLIRDLRLFALEIIHREMKISANGLYDLNWHKFLMILGEILSYLLFVIQYYLNMDRTF